MNIKKSDASTHPAFFTHIRGDRKALALLLMSVLAGTASAADNMLNLDNMTSASGAGLTAIEKGTITTDASGITTYVLNQNGGKGIADWTKFNIGTKEVLNLLNGTDGQTLFRIDRSNGESQIFGQLNAQGSLFLSNRAGIIFEPGSKVDVGQQFVATTGAITNDNFIAGKFEFTNIADDIHAKNGAQIEATSVALVGKNVSVPMITADHLAIGAFTDRVTVNMPTGAKITFDTLGSTAGDVSLRDDISVTGTANIAGANISRLSNKTLAAPDATLSATGNINLNTEVGTLTIENGTTVTITEADGLELKQGSGTIGSLDVTAGSTLNVYTDVVATDSVQLQVTGNSGDELRTKNVTAGASVDLRADGAVTTGDITITGNATTTTTKTAGATILSTGGGDVAVGNVNVEAAATDYVYATVASRGWEDATQNPSSVPGGNVTVGSITAKNTTEGGVAFAGAMSIVSKEDMSDFKPSTGTVTSSGTITSDYVMLSGEVGAEGDAVQTDAKMLIVTADENAYVQDVGAQDPNQTLPLMLLVTQAEAGTLDIDVEKKNVDVLAQTLPGTLDLNAAEGGVAVGNLTAGNVEITAGTGISADSVTATTGNVTLEAGSATVQGVIKVNKVTATAGAATLAAHGPTETPGTITNENADGPVEVNAATLTTIGDAQIKDVNTGTTNIAGITGANAVSYSKEKGHYNITGAINVENTVSITAEDGNISADTGADITGTDVTLVAKDGNATDTDSNGNINVKDVTATDGNIDIDADGTLTTGELTTGNGYISLNAGSTISHGIVTAGNKGAAVSSLFALTPPLGAGDFEAIQGTGDYVTTADINAADRLWIETTDGDVTLNNNVTAGKEATVVAGGTNNTITGTGTLGAKNATVGASGTITLNTNVNILTINKGGTVTITETGDDIILKQGAGEISDLDVTAAGNIILGTDITTTASDQIATLTANGNIDGDGHTLTADEAKVSASGDIDLNTNVDELTVENGQNVTITEEDGLTLSQGTGTIGTLNVTSTSGNIGLGSAITATGDATLTSTAGNIYGYTELAAANATLSAANTIELNTKVTELTIEKGTDVTIVETDGLVLNQAATSTNLDVTSTTGDITLGTDINATTNAALEATAGNIDGNGKTLTATKATLTAGENIGTANNALNTSADILDINAKKAYVTNNKTVSLSAGGVSDELIFNNGSADIVIAEDINATGTVDIDGATINANSGIDVAGGTVDINATGALTLNGVTSKTDATLTGASVSFNNVKANTTDGTAKITATAGDINGGTVTAQNAELTATNAGNINVITDVGNLTLDGGKDVYITEYSGVNLSQTGNAANNLNVEAARVTAGDITVMTDIAATNYLTLKTDKDGSILADKTETTVPTIKGGYTTLEASKSVDVGDVSGTASVVATAKTGVKVGTVTAGLSGATLTTETGDVTFTAVNSAGDATLTATAGNVGGDGTATGAEVTATKAVINAATVGSAGGNPLTTDIAVLDLTVGTNADIQDVGAKASPKETFTISQLTQNADSAVEIVVDHKDVEVLNDETLPGELLIEATEGTLTAQNIEAELIHLTAGGDLSAQNLTSTGTSVTAISDGNITVKDVVAETNAALLAEGSTTFNTVVAANTATVYATTGDVTSTNLGDPDVTAKEVVLSAGGTVNDIDVATTLVTINAANGTVTDKTTTADVEVVINQQVDNTDGSVVSFIKDKGNVNASTITGSEEKDQIVVTAVDGHLNIGTVTKGHDLTVTAGGDQNDITSTAGGITLTGTLTAEAGDDILLAGTTTAAKAELKAGDRVASNEAGDAANTAFGELSATVGDINLANATAMTVTKLNATNNAIITNAGDLTINAAVTAGGSVALEATNSALAGTGSVEADEALLIGGTIGTTGDAVEVNADTVGVAATAGGAYVADINTGATTLVGATANGDLVYNKADGNLTATGDISGANVTVSADDLDLQTVTTAGTATLTADANGSITVDALSAATTALTAQDVDITATGSTNLAAGGVSGDLAYATTGAINLTESINVADVDLEGNGITTAATDVHVTATTGDVSLDAGTGALAVNNVTATNGDIVAEGADVTFAEMTAKTLADIDATSDATGNVTGDKLTAKTADIDATGAVEGKTAGYALATSVDELALNAGSAYISNDKTVTLTEAVATKDALKVHTSGTSGGDITLATDVTAEGDASLYAFQGSIIGDKDTDVSSTTGKAHLGATNTITVGNVTAAQVTALNANGITAGDLTGASVAADAGTGNLKVGNVKATSGDARLVGKGTITAGSVTGATTVNIGDDGSSNPSDATTGKITLTGDVTATAGTATIVTKDAIEAKNVTATADKATLTAGNGIVAGNLTGVGVEANAGAGALTIDGNVDAGTAAADLDGTAITVGNITGTGVTADATTGAINADLVSAGTGDATLNAKTDVTTDGITAATATVKAETGAADVGTVEATTKADITAGTNVDAVLVKGPDVAITAGNAITATTEAPTLALSGKDINVTDKDTATGTVTLSGTGMGGTINYTDDGAITLKTDANTADDDVSVQATDIAMATEVQAVNATLTATTGAISGAKAVTATNNAALTAGTSMNVGAVTASNGTASFVAKDKIDIDGAVEGKVVTMHASAGNIEAASTVTATAGKALITAQTGVDIDGAVSATDLASIKTTTGDIATTGVKGTSVEMTAEAGAIADDGTVQSTTGDVVATAGTSVALTAVDAAKVANITAGTSVGATGTVTGKDVVILAKTDAVTLTDTVTAKDGDVTITAAKAITTADVEAVNGDITMTAATEDVTTGDLTAATGDVNVQATAGGIQVGALDAYTGYATGMVEAKDITLNAGDGSVMFGQAKATAGDLDVDATVNVGLWSAEAKKNVEIDAATGDVTFDTFGGGNILAEEGNVEITALNGTIDTTKATDVVATVGDVEMTATNITAGTTVAGTDVTMLATNAIVAETTTAGEDVSMTATDIEVDDTTATAGDVTMVATNSIKDLYGKTLAKDGDVSMNATTIHVSDTEATAGSITMGATQSVTSAVATAGKDIEMTAGTTLVATESTAGEDVTMLAGDTIEADTTTATNGAVEMKAANDWVKTGTVTAFDEVDVAAGTAVELTGAITTTTTADDGTVEIVAGTTITDETAANDAVITTNDLSLTAGEYVGEDTTRIQTATDTLTAEAAEGIYVNEADAVTVLQAVNTASGDIKITAGGTMTIDGTVHNQATAEEDVILETTADDIVVNGEVLADSGSITAKAAKDVMLANGAKVVAKDNIGIAAGNDVVAGFATILNEGDALEIGAANNVTLTGTSVGTIGDAYVHADAGAITMGSGAEIISDKDALLVAGTDATLDAVMADSRVHVVTGRDILRAAGSADNVDATDAILEAGGNIGAQGTETEEYLNVKATNLQAEAVGDAYITATAATTVKAIGGDTNVATVDAATGDETAFKQTVGATAGISANKLRLDVAKTTTTVAGAANADTTLVIEDAIVAKDDARIETASGSIEQDAEIDTGSDLVIAAEEDIHQNADTYVTGTATVEAGGSVIMDAGTLIASGDNTKVAAGEDVVLSDVMTSGNLLVDAGGNIIDVDADTVDYNTNGQATNLNDNDQSVNAYVGGNAVFNAGGSIGVAGDETGSSDGLDVSVDGNVAASAGGDLSIAAPDGDLNLGVVNDFTTNDVAFDGTSDATSALGTAQQDGIVSGGTANIIAKDSVVDANGDANNVTADKAIFTAGESVGSTPDGKPGALGVDVAGGENALWANSTTESTGGTIVSVKLPDGSIHKDVGAKPNSGVVFLVNDRYAGGDVKKKNFMTYLHAMNATQYPLAPVQFTVMDSTGMMYLDQDVKYIPGTEFIRHIRPMASLTWVSVDVDDNGKKKVVTETPFVPAYNPDEMVRKTSMK